MSKRKKVNKPARQIIEIPRLRGTREMARGKKAGGELSSSPDPLEILPPPRFSPFRRNPYSPHKQLQLRLLELNADIANDQTIENVLHELSPGRKNSFAFVEGKMSGRELLVTTRKPAAKAKRGRPRKENRGSGLNESPKRGRPRKTNGSESSGVPSGTPNLNAPAMEPSPSADDIRSECVEPFDIPDEASTHSYQDDAGFDVTSYNTLNSIQLEDSRCDSPIPVEPYRSSHSSSPLSPEYEEYQVPIPTSSSPVRRFSSDACFADSPERLPTPVPHPKRSRVRSRSASRERRMSFAPLQTGQGLPATPRRAERSEMTDINQNSDYTRSTDQPSPMGVMQHPAPPTFEVRQIAYNESMTPVRNWAAEIADGAFQSINSPSKLAQLPQSRQGRIHPVTVESEEDVSDDESELQLSEPFGLTENVSHMETPLYGPPCSPLNPKISTLRESPIIITSSPPDLPAPVHYRWKTVGDPRSDATPSPDADPEEPISPQESISQEPGRCLPRMSPAHSILTDMGEDVIDISSVSPIAAKRAANILLRTEHYSQITFSDEEGRRVWEDAAEHAGDYKLTQIETLSDDEAQLEDVKEESEDDEEEVMEIEPPRLDHPPRTSQGDWTKVDWKRLEKCLDLTDGDTSDAVDLFQERYAGREREEVEMRYRALLLARRRKLLEGKKVGFILGTDE